MHVSRFTIGVAALATMTVRCPHRPGLGRRRRTTGATACAGSGSHYTLNIIGVDKDKTADMTGSN